MFELLLSYLGLVVLNKELFDVESDLDGVLVVHFDQGEDLRH